jgi:hypothetical protein
MRPFVYLETSDDERRADLAGSPGSGKSSVLDALSTLLEIDATVFAALESEQLARGWPWLAITESLPQLAAVTALQRAAGRDLFLVVATTETSLELQGVIEFGELVGAGGRGTQVR